MISVPCLKREFEYNPGDEWRSREHRLSSTLMEHLDGIEGLKNFTAIDVGCGQGRLTLHLASRTARVVGIDWDPSQIDLARARAEELHFTHVKCVCGDAEKIEYRDLVTGGSVHLVVSNLCMSDAIMSRAYRALDRGGIFLFEAFHRSQWQETGIPSRFAQSEGEVDAVLRKLGFRVQYLGVEQDVVRFHDIEEFLESGIVSGQLREKWETDGRWTGLLSSFKQGSCRLTVRGHLIAKATKEGKT